MNAKPLPVRTGCAPSGRSARGEAQREGRALAGVGRGGEHVHADRDRGVAVRRGDDVTGERRRFEVGGGAAGVRVADPDVRGVHGEVVRLGLCTVTGTDTSASGYRPV